jgi:hypothetical protein
MPRTPKLVPLLYGDPYCELCREPIREKPDQLVAWWKIRRSDGHVMPTAYCSDCHHSNVRQGKALR